MTENIFAAAAGSFVSALRHTRSSLFKAVKVGLTGFALAYFTALDLAQLAHEYISVSISSGAAFFLVAYFGAELLEKAVFFIQSYRVAAKWK